MLINNIDPKTHFEIHHWKEDNDSFPMSSKELFFYSKYQAYYALQFMGEERLF